jgi:leucyl aminopeptidase (aminopeptidase T)
MDGRTPAVLDPRIEKLADVLVNYSMEIESGQVVVLNGTPLAQPLIAAVYRKIVEIDALRVVTILKYRTSGDHAAPRQRTATHQAGRRARYLCPAPA